MRCLILSLVLGVASLGLLAVSSSQAEAQFARRWRPAYNSYYYPGYTYSSPYGYPSSYYWGPTYSPGYYSYYSPGYATYSYGWPGYRSYYYSPGYYGSYSWGY